MLRRLIDFLPGLVDAWLALGNVYMESQDDKNAEEVFRHVAKNLNDSNSSASLMLAQVFIQQVLEVIVKI